MEREERGGAQGGGGGVRRPPRRRAAARRRRGAAVRGGDRNAAGAEAAPLCPPPCGPRRRRAAAARGVGGAPHGPRRPGTTSPSFSSAVPGSTCREPRPRPAGAASNDAKRGGSSCASSRRGPAATRSISSSSCPRKSSWARMPPRGSRRGNRPATGPDRAGDRTSGRAGAEAKPVPGPDAGLGPDAGAAPDAGSQSEAGSGSGSGLEAAPAATLPEPAREHTGTPARRPGEVPTSGPTKTAPGRIVVRTAGGEFLKRALPSPEARTIRLVMAADDPLVRAVAEPASEIFLL